MDTQTIRYYRDTAEVLRTRFPYAVLAFLSAVFLSMGAEYLWRVPVKWPELAASGIEVIVGAIAIWWVRHRAADYRSVWQVVFFSTLWAMAMLVGTAYVNAHLPGVLFADLTTLRLALLLLLFSTALLFPWGVWGQAAISVATVGAYYLVIPPFDTSALLGLLSLGILGTISTGAAFAMDRYRWQIFCHEATLYDTLRERERAVKITEKLIHISQELTAALPSSSDLLVRLGQLTAEVFNSDWSHTFLLDEERGYFCAEAGYGTTPEEDAAIRTIKLSSEQVAPVMAMFQQENPVVQLRMQEAVAHFPTCKISMQFGVTLALYFPLHRGETLVGIQSVAFRGRETLLGEDEQQIASGIGRIASLFLESARLVKELRLSHEFQTHFLTSMSHELRTPLNVIIGNLDMLRDEKDLPATEQQVCVHVSRRYADELLNRVEAALEISRDDHDADPLDVSVVDIESMLEVTVRGFVPLVKEKGLHIEWSVDPSLPPLHTDLRKLTMVLTNLIDNAVKYTEQGEVTIHVSTAEEHLRFTVCDTGIGIAEEMHQDVFQRFHRVQGAQGEGVGIGLYIACRLLQMLGGRIELESALGKGSVFSVWLPCTPPLSVPAQAGEEDIDEDAREQAPAPQPLSAPPPAGASHLAGA